MPTVNSFAEMLTSGADGASSRVHSTAPSDTPQDSPPQGEQVQSLEFIVGGKKVKMKDLARRAEKARRLWYVFSLINSVLLIAAIMLTAGLLAISAGLLQLPGDPTSLAVRLDILNWMGRVLLGSVFLVWIKFVWLDGWLFYPPSNPVAARRGATRAWFDKITFMVNEEPNETADGLAHALNITMRSKLRGAMIFVWAIFLAMAAVGVVAVTTFNFFSNDDFPNALSALVSYNWSVMRDAVVWALGGGTPLPDYLITPVAFALFVVAPFIALLFANELVVNAIDMRWSLLSSPDVLYKMLKYVLLVRNQAREYTFREAVKDARELVIQYGVDKIPEDFVDTEGDLFFYSPIVRSEFVRGTL